MSILNGEDFQFNNNLYIFRIFYIHQNLEMTSSVTQKIINVYERKFSSTATHSKKHNL